MHNKADWRNNRTEKGFCMKEIRTEDAVGYILCHDITQIIKGVIPFGIIMALEILLLCFFPEIATWLPGIVK